MKKTNEEILKKKLEKKERELKIIEDNKMIKIKVSGIIKKRVSKIVEIPFENVLSVSEYLFKIPSEKKKFLNDIKNNFPKGSEINVEVLK